MKGDARSVCLLWHELYRMACLLQKL